MKSLWKPTCWQNCVHNRISVSFKPSLNVHKGLINLQLKTANCKCWMCNYVFFHMGKKFAHSNLSILHLNKIFEPQVECLHRSLESQRVQSQIKAPLLCSRCRNCLCPALLMPWAGPASTEPQAPKAFSGVSALEAKLWHQLRNTSLR